MGYSASLSDIKQVLCQKGCLLSVFFFSMLVNTFETVAPLSEKCHTCRLGDGGMADGWVRRSVNVVYQIVHRNSAYCRQKNFPTNYSACMKVRCIVKSIWMKTKPGNIQL